jgi:hypothetical protein
MEQSRRIQNDALWQELVLEDYVTLVGQLKSGSRHHPKIPALSKVA